MIRAEGTGELVRLPSIDVSRISFAAMGAAPRTFGAPSPRTTSRTTWTAATRIWTEWRLRWEGSSGARRRESLRRAAEANEDAARRLATEARETARAVESLRQQRRRFEEARVVAERREKGVAVSGVAGEGRVAGSMPGDADHRPSSSSFADDDERELRDLRERRRRVDERIARLLEEAARYDREREMVAGSNPTRDDELALAVGDRERHRRLEEEAAARKDDDVDVASITITPLDGTGGKRSDGRGRRRRPPPRSNARRRPRRGTGRRLKAVRARGPPRGSRRRARSFPPLVRATTSRRRRERSS